MGLRGEGARFPQCDTGEVQLADERDARERREAKRAGRDPGAKCANSPGDPRGDGDA